MEKVERPELRAITQKCYSLIYYGDKADYLSREWVNCKKWLRNHPDDAEIEDVAHVLNLRMKAYMDNLSKDPLNEYMPKLGRPQKRSDGTVVPAEHAHWPGSEYMTRQEVADLLGYSPGYVSDLRKKGLEPLPGPGRSRYRRQDVITWAEGRAKRNEGDPSVGEKALEKLKARDAETRPGKGRRG